MIKFLLGEKRVMQFDVTNNDGDDFEIQEAIAEIYKANELVETINGAVDGHTILIPFEPSARGFYMIEVVVHVADEIRRKRFQIDVD